MTPALSTLLTFLAVGLAVVGVYSILTDLFLRDRARIGRRVDEEFRSQQREQARKSALFKNLGQLGVDVDVEDATASTQARFGAMVQQSGLKITPQRLLMLAAALGLGMAALCGLLAKAWIVGVMAGPVAAAVPILYVYGKRQARLENLQRQLPDAFDLMARVLRAGQTMAQALQAVADEFEPPIASEFAYCSEQQNLGVATETALRELARRTGLLEIKLFVLALLVQQQTGGNLAELLDKLASVVRERFRIRGKIRTLTAEGRMQAVVLLVLAPAMFLLILCLNRSYAHVLLDHPTLPVGALICEAIGALWIRRIVNFDF